MTNESTDKQSILLDKLISVLKEIDNTENCDSASMCVAALNTLYAKSATVYRLKVDYAVDCSAIYGK